ncbi:MAG: hypothetical protein ACR2MK_03185 [Solirubrobacteraceae bacterium]
MLVSCLAVTLTCGLARGAEHGAYRCPGVSFSTRLGDRTGELGFGIGSCSERGVHGPQRRGVPDLAVVGVVDLKAG